MKRSKFLSLSLYIHIYIYIYISGTLLFVALCKVSNSSVCTAWLRTDARTASRQAGLQPVNVFVQTLEEGFSRVGMSRSVGWVFEPLGDGCFFSVCRNLDFVSLLLPVPVTQYVLSEDLRRAGGVWLDQLIVALGISLQIFIFSLANLGKSLGCKNMSVLSLQQSEVGRIMASLPGMGPSP